MSFKIAIHSKPVEAEFLWEDRARPADDQGESLSIWRILNKCKKEGSDDTLYYEVQYWDKDGKNPVCALQVDDAMEQFPTQFAAWEAKFGDAWDLKYGNSPRVSKYKRIFDDTPMKAKSAPKKARMASSPLDSQVSRISATPYSMLPPPRPASPRTQPVRPTGSPGRESSDEDDVGLPRYRRSRIVFDDSDSDEEPARQDLSDEEEPARQVEDAKDDAEEDILPFRQVVSDDEHDDEADDIMPFWKVLDDSQDDSDDEIMFQNLISDKVSAGLKAIYDQSQREFEAKEMEESQAQDLEDLAASQAATQRQVNSTQAQVVDASQAQSQVATQQSQVATDDESQLDQDTQATSVQATQSDDGCSDVPQVSTHELYSRQLVNSLDENLWSLVETALNLEGMPCDDWVAARKTGSVFSFNDLISHLAVMLLGMDEAVMEHFVKGDLAQAAADDLGLAAKLRSLARTGYCPSIYVHYLADDDGISPTAQELLDALDDIRLYLEGYGIQHKQSSDWAGKVDNAIRMKWDKARSVAGERKYITKSSQATTCREWMAYLTARLETLDPDEALERPLTEVGYASKPVERLQQHAKHTSSNYLMNLMESTLMARYQDKYKMKQFVVLHTIHITHAMYAEILLSRIGLAYTTEGGGFSHHVAGASHGGADPEDENYYVLKSQKLFKTPSFRNRFKEESAKMEDLAKGYEGLMATAAEQNELKDGMGSLEGRILLAAKQNSAGAEKQARENLRTTELLSKVLELANVDIDLDE